MLTLTSCQNAYGEAFLQVTSSQSVIITSYGGAHGSRIREPFPVISAESVAGVIIESRFVLSCSVPFKFDGVRLPSF